ncbi:hypothetical protein XI03_01810 [Bradyrhizobium sp. CCBAU 65884]|uniref:hypothetical protein n=1 Tax=Bradyrhizobium sp. CCBAU 65884 TaxID=722477 RepID=UPI002306A280|nr:hypothetical protein [Bradyrhizobium sp. CCBAU 65884]MDA9473289.1 hypothetical protein [Bradyrhizobium sp. CCBAU 65884]
MANEQDVIIGRIAEIEIDKSAAIIVEQIDDEISITIASVVGVHLQVTAGQARELSRSLVVAAENAEKFRASAKT